MNRGTALLSKKEEDASARDASDRPGRAERKGSGRGVRTRTMFSGTIPRRTTPLPPLCGPPSPEEKVISRPFLRSMPLRA